GDPRRARRARGGRHRRPPGADPRAAAAGTAALRARRRPRPHRLGPARARPPVPRPRRGRPRGGHRPQPDAGPRAVRGLRRRVVAAAAAASGPRPPRLVRPRRRAHPVTTSWEPGHHLVLVGPTAVGKSAVALELATRRAARGEPVEIVSADSMQVYRGMDIGTAKPTPAERERLPHHLLDVVDPEEEFSVARYAREVRAVLADIESRG